MTDNLCVFPSSSLEPVVHYLVSFRGPSTHIYRIRMDTTSVKVFSTRNGSPHVSHVLDNVFELLQEVVTPFQPMSPTLSKSLPGQRNLFDIEIERAMDKLERERHVSLPMALMLPVELAPKSAPCPRLWRRRHMCDSIAEVATIKPRAEYRHALCTWRSTKRTLPGNIQVTADEALRHLNEAGWQDTVEQGQTHAKLSIETSQGPRMLRPTTLDLIIAPTGTKDQIQRTTSNFQNILVRVRAKYLDVKARYKLLKHRKVLGRGCHGQAPEVTQSAETPLYDSVAMRSRRRLNTWCNNVFDMSIIKRMYSCAGVYSSAQVPLSSLFTPSLSQGDQLKWCFSTLCSTHRGQHITL